LSAVDRVIATINGRTFLAHPVGMTNKFVKIMLIAQLTVIVLLYAYTVYTICKLTCFTT